MIKRQKPRTVLIREPQVNALTTGTPKAEAGHTLYPVSYKPTFRYDTDRNITFLTCVKILAEMMSTQEFKLFDKNKKIKETEAFSYILKRPNRFQNWADFMTFVERQRILKGDSIVWIRWDAAYAKVEELIPLDSAHVTMFVDDIRTMNLDTDIVYQYIDPNNGKAYTLRNDEVIHLRFNPMNAYRGTPAITALEQTLTTDRIAYDAMNGNASAGFGGIMILNLASDLSPSKREETAKQLKKMMENQRGASMLPLPPGINAQMFNNYISASDWDNIRKASNQEIASFFGVPGFLMGGESGAYGATQGAYNAFYYNTLKPIITQYALEFTTRLLTRKQVQRGLYFGVNNNGGLDLLGPQERVASYCQLKNSGILSADEIRDSFDYPLRGNEADALVTAGSAMGAAAGQQGGTDTNDSSAEHSKD